MRLVNDQDDITALLILADQEGMKLSYHLGQILAGRRNPQFLKDRFQKFRKSNRWVEQVNRLHQLPFTSSQIGTEYGGFAGSHLTDDRNEPLSLGDAVDDRP